MNTMGGVRPRNANDAYYTPPTLSVAICRQLKHKIGEAGLIIEPSAGTGSFVRAARAEWPKAEIVACEPDTEAHGVLGSSGYDVLFKTTWEQATVCIPAVWKKPTLILGNPPFLLAEDHVRLALERLGHFKAPVAGTGWLAFLLRASFLAGGKRSRELHIAIGGLRYVWHVAGRPSFTGNGKSDGAEYAVLVWQAGYRGPYAGDWLFWK